MAEFVWKARNIVVEGGKYIVVGRDKVTMLLWLHTTRN